MSLSTRRSSDALRRPSPGRAAWLRVLACLALCCALVAVAPARAQQEAPPEGDADAQDQRAPVTPAEPAGRQGRRGAEGGSIPTIPDLGGRAGRGFLAQQTESGAPAPVLTLAEAVRVALSESYTLQRTRLDVENAQAQIRGAWSSVFPSVDLNSSYTRNVIQANPFAGGDVGLFAGGGATEWVTYNERARTDMDPATEPITLEEFQTRQEEGQRDAGIDPEGIGGNPFTVDNQFQNALSITQPLFNGQAFVAIQGAETLEAVNELAATREEQTVVNQTRQAYYQALLSAEQARVTAQNVERTRETFNEVARQVAAGTAPKYERVSTRVELENLRAQLTERTNAATNAIDQLKRTIGFPVDQPVRLQGALRADDLGRFTQVSAQDAMAEAVESRPDVRRASLAVDLRQNQKRQTQAQYLPTVSAFADFTYVGRVPDDRTNSSNLQGDPFTFEQTSQGFFADNLWNPSVAVGLQLSWNIFGGFQRAAQVEQDQVAINQARVDYEQLLAQVRLEVQQALRNLATARGRIRSQSANVERAELNYDIAERRLGVGASTRLELREASDQLDQARLNYLQAVYDYLTARSAYETAIGEPASEDSLLRFTSR